MKKLKTAGLILGILSSFIIISSLASAYWYTDFSTAGYTVIQWIQDIFGPFFEVLLGVSIIDEHFFSRILLLILVYVFALLALKKMDLFKKNIGAAILISAIVSILGIRYLSSTQFIDFILLPHGVMFMAISIYLPLLVYAMMIHFSVQSSLGRRLGWILFGVVFIGLWVTRFDETQDLNWIYLLALIILGLLFIFDGTLHEYFNLMEFRRSQQARMKTQISDLETRVSYLRLNNPNPSQVVKDQIKALEDEIKRLYKKL